MRVVVHAHPVYGTVHAICGKPLTQQIMPEYTMFLGEVPLTPYGLSSTDELSDAIRPCLARHDALLLQNHGAYTCGHDLQSAWFTIKALDYYAKVIFLASKYGGAHEFDKHEVHRLVANMHRRFPVLGHHVFIDRCYIRSSSCFPRS